MNIYRLLYLAEHDVAERFAKATPEEAAQGFAAWQAWRERIGEAGKDKSGLIDMGLPLGSPVDYVMENGGLNKKASDCKVIGSSLVQANDGTELEDMLKDHPHLAFGTVTVLLQMPIPELQHA